MDASNGLAFACEIFVGVVVGFWGIVASVYLLFAALIWLDQPRSRRGR